MSVHDIIKDIQNWFHGLVKSLKPALDYAESHGGDIALGLAETVLNTAAGNAPWNELIATLIAQAKTQGLQLLEAEAAIILNLAKANVLAKAAA